MFNVTAIQVPLFLVIVINSIHNVLLTILVNKMFLIPKNCHVIVQCPVTLTIRQIVPPNICPAGRGVMTSPCHILMIALLFTLAFYLLGYLSFSLQLDRLIVFQLGYLLETGVYFIQCEQVKFFNVMPCLQ